ncbi:MAG TPA: ADP-glyceromanno-heptose 6-epimerase [Syntrophales bacterium]|nr:ADP-glyceromanno-heptose 6-epimerase [Syntrophales bacterium]HRT61804.1 ADP-glyceromanno-heptose 6-epimerase [Syntrophales bacterium]
MKKSSTKKDRIIVTGGAGFIGSAMVWKLNEEGLDRILIVDRLGTTDKWKNLAKRRFADYMHKDEFLQAIRTGRFRHPVQAVIHMGACSSTTERDADYLMSNNYRYSVELAKWALAKGVRFIYASSAATYGDGSRGFSDDDGVTGSLLPINMYGYSKQLFDLWVLSNRLQKRVVGIKFFNVFGPNEYHKEDMRSMVHKSFGQIGDTGKVRLFKSHRPDYGDGEQRRDFVYVKDCVEVLWWFYRNRKAGGIFNLGSGYSRTWNDLTQAVFDAVGAKKQIDYIEMPEAIRDQYQYFTEARIDKLRSAGCPVTFRSLEDAVYDYVVNHLKTKDPYL